MLRTQMQKLVKKLSEQLQQAQSKVVTVESCTGGWIGKILTDQAGSSEWFSGGLITYSNESKIRLLNIPAALLEERGAVSTEVAAAMAMGVHQYFNHCISIAVSGIAGPGGGSNEKPVGTVCIATGFAKNVTTKRFLFEGDREQVRYETVRQAIIMALGALSSKK